MILKFSRGPFAKEIELNITDQIHAKFRFSKSISAFSFEFKIAILLNNSIHLYQRFSSELDGFSRIILFPHQ